MAYKETKDWGNKRDILITRPSKCRKVSKNTAPTKTIRECHETDEEESS